MEIEPGTPLANAIKAAQAAARRGDVHGIDHYYREAAKVTWIIAHDHCASLLAHGAIAKAALRCDEYLAQSNDVELRVLRAQIRSAATDHANAARDVRQLRKLKLSELQQAVLARVAALAAADRFDFPTAESELDAAERHFRRAGRTEHLERVGDDRVLLDVRRGAHVAKIAGPAPRSPAEFLRRAAALRREVRYEEALALMTRCATSFEIEPALRVAVVHELTVLLVLTRQAGAARRLFPLLVAAAGPEALSRLPDATGTLTPERCLDRVRRLIADGRLVTAEGLLGPGESALWHLTKGELAYAGGQLDQAAPHFRAAARSKHAELKALALRKLGDTCADTGDEEQASRHWAASRHLEDADHHNTELRLLYASRDEHDDRVLAAARRVQREGRKALAGLVVAMETGTHDLPGFTDLPAARRWLGSTIRPLSRDQVVWMTHPTPDQIHHVIIGRSITHLTTDVHISELTDAIRRLTAWNPRHHPTIFGTLLVELAALIGLKGVLDALPPKTTRIAVVAGGVLADVPFAGLPVPGTHRFLGLTHALSVLPSLSSLPVLHRRARGQRSDETVIRVDARSRHERMTAETLGSMDFSRCGTLVLGVESRGRDRARGARRVRPQPGQAPPRPSVATRAERGRGPAPG